LDYFPPGEIKTTVRKIAALERCRQGSLKGSGLSGKFDFGGRDLDPKLEVMPISLLYVSGGMDPRGVATGTSSFLHAQRQNLPSKRGLVFPLTRGEPTP